MKKIVLALFLFAGIHAAAQQSSINFGNMLSSNQQLIEDAVKDGFFIIRQRYQLQDTTARTPTYFGWQNRDWFGESYSLGVKVKTGYYLFDKAIIPWLYDTNFEQYKTNSKYVPVLSDGDFRTFENIDYQSLPRGNALIKEGSSNRIFLLPDTSSFQQKGFSVDTGKGEKKGWLVWVTTDKPLEEQPDQKPSCLIYRLELNFEQGKNSYDVKDPATDKNIVGGFYFLPEITDIGQITFSLSGVLLRENGSWQVAVLSNSTNQNIKQPNSSESGLTPIKNDKSNKADNPPPRGRRK
ncbi:MAG: hypothetical protein LBE56_02620 [Tannerella sp.]|jgi:hypothetical protein|nr:hypothetical protein [Tannerella sp.]